MSLLVYFCAVLFSMGGVLNEIWDLIESVSEGFSTYKHGVIKVVSLRRSSEKLWRCIPLP